MRGNCTFPFLYSPSSQHNLKYIFKNVGSLQMFPFKTQIELAANHQFRCQLLVLFN